MDSASKPVVFLYTVWTVSLGVAVATLSLLYDLGLAVSLGAYAVVVAYACVTWYVAFEPWDPISEVTRS